MDTSREDLMRKLRALKAKADGTDNEHERDAFATKFAELLIQHNLTEADVRASKPEDTEDIADYSWQLKYLDPWRQAIIGAAARLYFCAWYMSVWYDRGRERPAILLVGRPHNVAVCKEIAGWLMDWTVRHGKEYSSVRREYLAFERGCGETIAYRLNQKYLQMQAEARAANVAKATGAAPPGASIANLPALYESEAKRADSWAKAKYSIGKAAPRKGSKLDSVHSVAGAAKGREAPIDSTQVGDSGSSRQIGAR